MEDRWLDEMALEREAKDNFGMAVEIDKVVAHEVDVARAVKATVFLTKKKQLVCYIHGHTKLLLSDIKKIIVRMGLRVETYMPPKGQPTYFDDIGREKFREVFPGRGNISDQDIAFYRTLAPYNPALVLISEVRDGVIYQYDSDSRTGWRPAVKFAYRRIKTS
jgi:hypothetical protein